MVEQRPPRTTTHVLPAQPTSLVARRPVLVFFACAYGISWALWLPLVATAQGWWEVNIPDWWHYTGAYGPLLAALAVAWLTEGHTGIQALWSQYRLARVRPGWLLFAIGSPLVLLSIGLGVVRLVDGAWPSLADLSHAGNLPALALPLTLLIHILTFGIGEETGWRGFALPRLQRERIALRATGLLWLGWAGWHLPTFFENNTFTEMGAVQLIGWCAGLWMGAIFLTWLYNSSRGSLLVVVLWHGVYNQFAASEASAIIPAVLTFGVILLAIGIMRLAGPEELTGFSRHAGQRVTHP